MNEWLNSCPLPIVARVLDNKEDILHLASAAHIYEKDMLVTVRVDALSETIDHGLRTRIKKLLANPQLVRLHMGELSESEMLTLQAFIKWMLRP